jgi:tRNA (guanine-N7-)-methyltransferase
LIVEPIGVEVRNLPKPVDTKVLFGNQNPLELEVGSGKGTFLSEQAKGRPEINFLGLERARRYWRYASDRLRRNGCFNTRVVLSDAAYFLSEFVSDESLAAIHIYFPDPWPKKRHHKRRLIQIPFMAHLARVLKPGGRLQVVTDHQDYFEQIERVILSSTLELTEYQSPGSAAEGEFVGSNFERKYRREKRPFSAIAAVKGGGSS